MNLNPTVFKIDSVMESLPLESRYRWCEAKYCCCLGCCTRGSEGLIALGFNKGDWNWWVTRHPEPEKDEYGKHKQIE